MLNLFKRVETYEEVRAREEQKRAMESLPVKNDKPPAQTIKSNKSYESPVRELASEPKPRKQWSGIKWMAVGAAVLVAVLVPVLLVPAEAAPQEMPQKTAARDFGFVSLKEYDANKTSEDQSTSQEGQTG